MFTFIIAIFISVGSYRLINIVLKRGFEEEIALKYSVWLALILFVAIYFGSAYYGFKIPGIVFERSEYETMANLKVKQGNAVRSLSGKIYKGVDTFYEKNHTYYLLIYLELPSGEKRYFTNNGNLTGKRLQLERFETLTDDYGDKWDVRLVPFLPYYLWMNR